MRNDHSIIQCVQLLHYYSTTPTHFWSDYQPRDVLTKQRAQDIMQHIMYLKSGVQNGDHNACRSLAPLYYANYQLSFQSLNIGNQNFQTLQDACFADALIRIGEKLESLPHPLSDIAKFWIFIDALVEAKCKNLHSCQSQVFGFTFEKMQRLMINLQCNVQRGSYDACHLLSKIYKIGINLDNGSAIPQDLYLANVLEKFGNGLRALEQESKLLGRVPANIERFYKLLEALIAVKLDHQQHEYHQDYDFTPTQSRVLGVTAEQLQDVIIHLQKQVQAQAYNSISLEELRNTCDILAQLYQSGIKLGVILEEGTYRYAPNSRKFIDTFELQQDLHLANVLKQFGKGLRSLEQESKLLGRVPSDIEKCCKLLEALSAVKLDHQQHEYRQYYDLTPEQSSVLGVTAEQLQGVIIHLQKQVQEQAYNSISLEELRNACDILAQLYQSGIKLGVILEEGIYRYAPCNSRKIIDTFELQQDLHLANVLKKFGEGLRSLEQESKSLGRVPSDIEKCCKLLEALIAVKSDHQQHEYHQADDLTPKQSEFLGFTRTKFLEAKKHLEARVQEKCSAAWHSLARLYKENIILPDIQFNKDEHLTKILTLVAEALESNSLPENKYAQLVWKYFYDEGNSIHDAIIYAMGLDTEIP